MKPTGLSVCSHVTGVAHVPVTLLTAAREDQRHLRDRSAPVEELHTAHSCFPLSIESKFNYPKFVNMLIISLPRSLRAGHVLGLVGSSSGTRRAYSSANTIASPTASPSASSNPEPDSLESYVSHLNENTSLLEGPSCVADRSLPLAPYGLSESVVILLQAHLQRSLGATLTLRKDTTEPRVGDAQAPRTLRTTYSSTDP